MPQQQVYHVEPAADEFSWVVKEASGKAIVQTQSKTDAVCEARRLAQHHGLAQVKIHAADGTCEEHRYGKNLRNARKPRPTAVSAAWNAESHTRRVVTSAS